MREQLSPEQSHPQRQRKRRRVRPTKIRDERVRRSHPGLRKKQRDAMPESPIRMKLNSGILSTAMNNEAWMVQYVRDFFRTAPTGLVQPQLSRFSRTIRSPLPVQRLSISASVQISGSICDGSPMRCRPCAVSNRTVECLTPGLQPPIS